MAESFSPDFVEFMKENINKEKAFMKYFEIETRKACLNFGNSSFSIAIPIQYRNLTCLNTLRINLEKIRLKYVHKEILSMNEFAFFHIDPDNNIQKSVTIDYYHKNYLNFTHIMLYI